MTRFKFRLERVQRVREVEEDLAKARFAGADGLARAAEARALALSSALKAAQGQLRQLQSTPTIDLALVLAAHQALESLGLGVRAAEERAKSARATAEIERQAWIQRRQAVQSLERLEVRSRAVFAEEQERVERITLDEAAGVRNMRLKSDRSSGR
jgi:flagellar export protein FliJ